MDIFDGWISMSRNDILLQDSSSIIRRRTRTVDCRSERGKQNNDNSELSPSFKQNGCQNEGFQYDLEPTGQLKHLYRPKNGFNHEHTNGVWMSNESKSCRSDNVQHGADNTTQTGHSSGQRLSASCHDCVQTETRLGDPNQEHKKKHSCCLKVLLTVLVVAVVCSGVAVILKYIVFDAGESKQSSLKVTFRPVVDILTLEGSLDLIETWTSDLYDPHSTLYISVVENFTKEIDNIMKRSSFADSYIRTDVTGLRPGSIKVSFNMLHNDKYQVKTRSAPEFASLVEERIRGGAVQSSLPIDRDTINLNVKTWTPMLFPSAEYSSAETSNTIRTTSIDISSRSSTGILVSFLQPDTSESSGTFRSSILSDMVLGSISETDNQHMSITSLPELSSTPSLLEVPVLSLQSKDSSVLQISTIQWLSKAAQTSSLNPPTYQRGMSTSTDKYQTIDVNKTSVLNKIDQNQVTQPTSAKNVSIDDSFFISSSFQILYRSASSSIPRINQSILISLPSSEKEIDFQFFSPTPSFNVSHEVKTSSFPTFYSLPSMGLVETHLSSKNHESLTSTDFSHNASSFFDYPLNVSSSFHASSSSPFTDYSSTVSSFVYVPSSSLDFTLNVSLSVDVYTSLSDHILNVSSSIDASSSLPDYTLNVYSSKDAPNSFPDYTLNVSSSIDASSSLSDYTLNVSSSIDASSLSDYTLNVSSSIDASSSLSDYILNVSPSIDASSSLSEYMLNVSSSIDAYSSLSDYILNVSSSIDASSLSDYILNVYSPEDTPTPLSDYTLNVSSTIDASSSLSDYTLIVSSSIDASSSLSDYNRSVSSSIDVSSSLSDYTLNVSSSIESASSLSDYTRSVSSSIDASSSLSDYTLNVSSSIDVPSSFPDYTISVSSFIESSYSSSYYSLSVSSFIKASTSLSYYTLNVSPSIFLSVASPLLSDLSLPNVLSFPSKVSSDSIKQYILSSPSHKQRLFFSPTPFPPPPSLSIAHNFISPSFQDLMVPSSESASLSSPLVSYSSPEFYSATSVLLSVSLSSVYLSPSPPSSLLSSSFSSISSLSLPTTLQTSEKAAAEKVALSSTVNDTFQQLNKTAYNLTSSFTAVTSNALSTHRPPSATSFISLFSVKTSVDFFTILPSTLFPTPTLKPFKTIKTADRSFSSFLSLLSSPPSSSNSSSSTLLSSISLSTSILKTPSACSTAILFSSPIPVSLSSMSVLTPVLLSSSDLQLTSSMSSSPVLTSPSTSLPVNQNLVSSSSVVNTSPVFVSRISVKEIKPSSSSSPAYRSSTLLTYNSSPEVTSDILLMKTEETTLANYTYKTKLPSETTSAASTKMSTTHKVIVTTEKTTATTLKQTEKTLKNNGKVLASADLNVTNIRKIIITPAPDKPPIADAGSDIVITLPKTSALLDGSASKDDHGIRFYQWQKLSPTTPIEMIGTDSKVLSIGNLKEGTYIFRLTVVDGVGQKDSDVVRVLVQSAPTTVITPQKALCLPVNVALCRNKGFTQTVFPNYFGHNSEQEAIDAFNYVARSAVNTLCEEAVVTYLCSMYFPMCDPKSGYFSNPCKRLCTEASTTCESYFTNPFPCEYFQETDCVDVAATTIAPVTTTEKRTCEMTRLRECFDLGFNETIYPNLFFEPDQSSTIESFNGYFRGVLSQGCHRDAWYFICSIQFPKCIDGIQKKPCRSLCYDVTNSCTDIAAYFDCNKYPAMDCLIPAKQFGKSPQPQQKSSRRMCRPDEFTCKRTQKCIYKDKLCNGVDDCGDWTDEMECVCGQYEFQCDMGMCIKSYQQCDGVPQCPDNSDENKCDGCTHGQVKCPSGKCIMSEWLCDGRAECEDAWDEINCDTCAPNQFTCADRNHTCIDVSRRCDNVADCPDGEDEWECINNENGILQLRYKKFWLPICADSWTEEYGEYACTQLLGEGAYINKTDITHNVYNFAKLSPEGRFKSVLGPMTISGDCPSNKAVRVSCEPRGCGKRMVDIVSYIVNGEDAAPGAWPWHAALYFGGQYFCGGSLISDSFVLTAAHCVDKFVRDFSMMTVKLGANNREESEETQHVVKVDAIESHTDHVYFKKNDIALLQLERPVQFTKYIQPICLPEPGDPLPLHSTCFTIGWGKKKWDGDYAEVLQELKMTLWDTQKCNSSIAWNGDIYDTFLCAGYYSGIRSICKGESGGPLLCLVGYQTWKIFGVASYVANFCNMTERPNIYTSVNKLMPWIHQKTECKFRCDNGRCLYYTNQICDRIDHCGDNSDEMRVCNRTVTCDFEDKYLCGYEFKGWKLGYDNKLAARIEIDGQLHTQSNAPQFDHTRGRFPGNFFYGKQKEVLNAELWSPRFGTDGQTCIRFAYYQRGEINLGLSVFVKEYIRGRSDDIFSESRRWTSGRMFTGFDEWKTGYFDVSIGDFRVNFQTGDLLKTAIDDVVMIPGMCRDVLCTRQEFRCHARIEDKCIPVQSQCNLVIDCLDAGYEDEIGCTKTPSSYICTFDDGNLCALHQEVGDASDWWLVNATFVREETGYKDFVDHTSLAADGNMFYINAYGLQTSAHINMWQLFYLHSAKYCFYFYYQMKSNVTFNIYVDCRGCVQERYIAKPTFEDNWTLFQFNLPAVDVVNITYVVEGNERSEGFFRSYIALDDIIVKAGSCPKYVCPDNYRKCRSTDRCIPQSALCDRRVDCVDESDEEQCECTAEEYRCSSGRCISKAYMCDRTPNCLDRSDEGPDCKRFRSVSCTFEHPYMCGYEFLQYTNFHWHRHKGRTPTPITGPVSDHTYRNDSGHYMYTEANEGSKGDNASMLSPDFKTMIGQSFEFYYHMYSASGYEALPGVLELSVENMRTRDITIEWQAPVFDLHDKWRRICVDLPDNAHIRLRFTVIRNETTIYGVDMAIDDTQLNNYRCSEATSPPPSTARGYVPSTVGPKCRENEWECGEGTCVPLSYRCDHESDCPDSSDERNCP